MTTKRKKTRSGSASKAKASAKKELSTKDLQSVAGGAKLDQLPNELQHQIFHQSGLSQQDQHNVATAAADAGNRRMVANVVHPATVQAGQMVSRTQALADASTSFRRGARR
jgi:bacteriocin-like protein